MSGESVNTDVIDIEEQLVKFTLRSYTGSCKLQTEDKSASRNYKIETDLIPLLVKDIHKLTLPDRSFSETISAFGIPFCSALVYGRICSTGADANGKRKYSLDDGTGVIQVRLLKHHELNDLANIDLQCYRTFGNNKDLYKSVQNILKTTRKQMLDIGSISYGTKALLIGRPYKFYEEIGFSVFEMILDNGYSRDLEISVKNFIIYWYSQRFKDRQQINLKKTG